MWSAFLARTGLLAACGGEAKPAGTSGVCPPGTVLRGSDCLPAETSDDSQPSGPKKVDHESAGDAPAVTSAQGGASDAGDAVSYDREAVETQLKRGARQVKANCGSATDADGNRTGPWGTTRASIVLGRNGHVRKVTLEAPYDGKPVGDCVVHAFEKLLFPPYAGSSDVALEWDVELVKPKTP